MLMVVWSDVEDPRHGSHHVTASFRERKFQTLHVKPWQTEYTYSCTTELMLMDHANLRSAHWNAFDAGSHFLNKGVVLRGKYLVEMSVKAATITWLVTTNMHLKYTQRSKCWSIVNMMANELHILWHIHVHWNFTRADSGRHRLGLAPGNCLEQV